MYTLLSVYSPSRRTLGIPYLPHEYVTFPFCPSVEDDTVHDPDVVQYGTHDGGGGGDHGGGDHGAVG